MCWCFMSIHIIHVSNITNPLRTKYLTCFHVTVSLIRSQLCAAEYETLTSSKKLYSTLAAPSKRVSAAPDIDTLKSAQSKAHQYQNHSRYFNATGTT